MGAVYLAKVQISKQITTVMANVMNMAKVLFTLQRYKFLSKSQPEKSSQNKVGRCCLPCKGTNF